MTILNLPFSFVQFAPISQTDYILPVFKESDVWFSLIVRGDNYAEAQDIYLAADTEMQLLLLQGYDNVPASVPGQTLRNYTVSDGLKFRKYKVSNTDVLFVWQHNLPRVVTNTPLISCKECFQLGLLFRNTRLVSNIFKKVCNDADTTFIQFYSDDNSFQFYYCNTGDFQNRIRVPALLRSPQIVTDQNIYLRSNGTRKVTKSVKSKEYNMLIDFADISLHEKIDMALSHDTVYVESRAYSGNIVGSGNYNIDWEGALNKYQAQGECKIIVSPYNAKNSNCGVCAECIAPSIIISDIIARSNSAFTIEIPISGTGPFTLENITKPSWMVQFVLDNNLLKMAGSTPEGENSYSISFSIVNCFGTESYNASFNIETKQVDPPSNLVVVPSGWAASATWDAVPGASYYEVDLKNFNTGLSVGDFPSQITETNSSFGTIPNTPYEFSVRVFKDGLWSNKSVNVFNSGNE